MLSVFMWMLLALSAVLGALPATAPNQSRQALDLATQWLLRDDGIAALLTLPEEILFLHVGPSNEGLPIAHGLKMTSPATAASPSAATNVTAPVAAKALTINVVAADQFPRALVTPGLATTKATNVTAPMAAKHCTIGMAAADQLAQDLATTSVTTVEAGLLSKTAQRMFVGTSVSAFVWCIAFAPEKVAAWTRRMEASPTLAPCTLLYFLTIPVAALVMAVAALMAGAYSEVAPRASIALVKIARALAWAATTTATCVGCVVALEGKSVAALGRISAAVLDGIAAAHERVTGRRKAVMAPVFGAWVQETRRSRAHKAAHTARDALAAAHAALLAAQDAMDAANAAVLAAHAAQDKATWPATAPLPPPTAPLVCHLELDDETHTAVAALRLAKRLGAADQGLGIVPVTDAVGFQFGAPARSQDQRLTE